MTIAVLIIGLIVLAACASAIGLTPSPDTPRNPATP